MTSNLTKNRILAGVLYEQILALSNSPRWTNAFFPDIVNAALNSETVLSAETEYENNFKAVNAINQIFGTGESRLSQAVAKSAVKHKGNRSSGAKRKGGYPKGMPRDPEKRKVWLAEREAKNEVSETPVTVTSESRIDQLEQKMAQIAKKAARKTRKVHVQAEPTEATE